MSSTHARTAEAPRKDDLAIFRKRIEELTKENHELIQDNTRLVQALEDRSNVNIIFSFRQKKTRGDKLRLEITPIAVTDASQEGNDIYIGVVDALHTAEDRIPEEINWRSFAELPVNEVRDLPSGVSLNIGISAKRSKAVKAAASK